MSRNPVTKRPSNAPRAYGSLAFVVVASLSALGLSALAAVDPMTASADGAAVPAQPPYAGASGGRPYAAPAVPGGFEGWAKVTVAPSAALFGQPAGVHHIYANPAAWAGYSSGQWEDGAVLVFDVVDGAGTRLRTDVMVRDQAAYAATGGWGYGEWLEAAAPAIDQAGDPSGHRLNRLVAANPGGICHTCHVRLAGDRGFVVSKPAN